MNTIKIKSTLLFLGLLLLSNIKLFSQFPSSVLVGYWHNWESTRLISIDDRYNVLMLSFLEADKDFNQDNNSVNDLEFTPYNKTQLKSDIPTVQGEGKKVIISIGGANGSFRLNNSTEKNTFVTKVKDFITEYGVDGIDIDLERSAYMCTSSGTLSSPETWLQNTIDGVKELLTWYQTTYGKKMLLTTAPEVAYTTGGISPWGSCKGTFLPFIEQLRDDIDLLMIQLYNSGSSYSINYPSNSTAYNQGGADFVITQTEAAIEGFTIGNTSSLTGTYSGMPASKVVVALPACSGGGYVGKTNTVAAIKYLMGTGSKPGAYTLTNSYPNLRGMMTWSANNDAGCGYDFADTYDALEDEFALNNKPSEQQTIISVYPNPAIEVLNINSEVDLGTVQIIDNNGRVIISKNNVNKITTINIENLSSGFYTVKAGFSTQKFVKK